jgi:hypothetical protein
VRRGPASRSTRDEPTPAASDAARIAAGAAGCIAGQTHGKSYRDWFLLRCSISLVLGLGRNKRKTEPMAGTAFFFATLGALVAAKCAARIAVDRGRFDGLPRPTQID